jgi:parallel beta-helix repeat protein
MASSLVVAVLFLSLCVFAFGVRGAKAQSEDPIVINPNGTISSPVSANITSSDNVTYTFTGNNYLPIIVNRSNIVINGMRHTLQASGADGFSLTRITNVTIKDVTITGGYDGIFLDHSSGGVFLGNEITNNLNGVELDSSSNCTVSGNNITGNSQYGVFLDLFSNYGTVSGNNITNNEDYGVYLYYSSNCIISGNRVLSNVDSAVTLESSSNCTVSGNNLAYNDWDGVELWYYCNYCTVSGNSITNDSNYGVEVKSSSYVTVLRNDITKTPNGVALESSSGCVVSGNNITNNGGYGVFLDSSSGDVLSGNNVIANGQYGIVLDSSSGNALSGNSVTANSVVGVYLMYSSDSNTLFGNNVTANNAIGIDIKFSSDNNTLSGNNVTANSQAGIDLGSSSNNTLSGNSIASNHWGVYFQNSSDNQFYHNNFINNPQQVYSDGSPNTWDNGYPSGGNYWSDYRTTYPGAVENDSSAIWNTAYVIDSNNTDTYPLMGPFHTFSVGAWSGVAYSVDTVSNSTITNVGFNATAKTLNFNVTGLNGTKGFCRVAIPTGLMWTSTPDQWTLIVGGVLYSNQTIIQSGNYTYIYFTYHQSTQMVKITSTGAVPEFRPFMLLPLFMIITLLGAMILKRNRRDLCPSA